MRIYADLHIHSYVSDGEPSPVEIVKYSLKKGLNIISVTDHDTFLGSVLALNAAKDLGKILVVPGAEVRTLWGDVLVLCRDPIKVIQNPIELCEEAGRNSCVLIPAHPFDLLRLGIGSRVRYRALWDGYEVFNSSSDPLANLISFIYLKDLGKPLLSNSDAHTLEGIGISRNIIEINEMTVDDGLEAIRRGLIEALPGYSVYSLISKLRWSLRLRSFSRTLKSRRMLFQMLQESLLHASI